MLPIVLKSESLDFLETSGPVQASNGIALPLILILDSIKRDIWMSRAQRSLVTTWQTEMSNYCAQWTWTMFRWFEISYSQTYFLSGFNGLVWKYHKNSKLLSQNYDVIRKTMYVKGNIEALLCDHCCSGKALSIAHCECVFVTLGIQHAMPIRPIHLWTVRLYNIFPHCLINEWFSIKKNFENKIRVSSFSTKFLWNISHYMKNRARCNETFLLVVM
jgi:hypothetical protein